MNRSKKLLFSLLLPAALMLAYCGNVAAQSQPTVTMTSYKCSGSSCSIKFKWDDPNNPSPEDSLVEMSECCGDLGSFYGNSGTGEFYNLYGGESPVAAVLEDYQGDWLAEMWCYIDGAPPSLSVECE